MPTSVNRIKLWSVGGGKGGIGKSLVTLGLGSPWPAWARRSS